MGDMEAPAPYAPCRLCPRRCGVMRRTASAEPPGYCGEAAGLRLAGASIHRGEEPPITGRGGSGTIFVSGCNLGCGFCQNRQISLGLRGNPGAAAARRGAGPFKGLGRLVDTEELARICLTLQGRGAENINIVTGSHAVPALVDGIAAARRGPASGEGRGGGPLSIPVLWNSSAYEVPETLELLSGAVEVFLPDLKTLDRSLSERYYNAPNYPETAAAAIGKMLELRRLRFEERAGSGEVMVSGVMVRHLVLPGHLDSTRKVLRWFAEHCAGRALLSLMFQYTDMAAARPADFPAERTGPDRRISEAEYHTVLGWLREYGVEDGYCQEPPGSDPAADAEWLPDFERTNPFPSELSTPVWHWREGFV